MTPDPSTLHAAIERAVNARGLLAARLARAVRSLGFKAPPASGLTSDARAFREWVAASLSRGVPSRVKGLLFELSDPAGNPPDVTLHGYGRFDPRNRENFGWEDESWSPGSQAAPFLRLAGFDVVRRSLAANSPELADAVGVCVIALLADEAIRALVGARTSKPIPVGVAVHDAEVILICTLSARGRVSAPPLPPEPPRDVAIRKCELDPDDVDFKPLAYIKKGLDVNARDPDGVPMLLRCAGARDDELVALIKAGADPNASDPLGRTPMLELAGNPALVAAMLAAGGNPRARRRGYGVLNAAFQSVGAFKLLVAAGAPLDAHPKGAGTLLHDYDAWRRSNGDSAREALRIMLEGGLDLEGKDKSGRTPLWACLEEYLKDQLDQAKAERAYLKAYGAPMPPSPWDGRQDQTALMLLEAGADPNARLAVPTVKRIPGRATPLMLPRYRDGAMHLALLNHGADPALKSAEGLTALDYAERAAPDLGSTAQGLQRVREALRAAIKPRGKRPAPRRP